MLFVWAIRVRDLSTTPIEIVVASSFEIAVKHMFGGGAIHHGIMKSPLGLRRWAVVETVEGKTFTVDIFHKQPCESGRCFRVHTS